LLGALLSVGVNDFYDFVKSDHKHYDDLFTTWGREKEGRNPKLKYVHKVEFLNVWLNAMPIRLYRAEQLTWGTFAALDYDKFEAAFANWDLVSRDILEDGTRTADHNDDLEYLSRRTKSDPSSASKPGDTAPNSKQPKQTRFVDIAQAKEDSDPKSNQKAVQDDDATHDSDATPFSQIRSVS